MAIIIGDKPDSDFGDPIGMLANAARILTTTDLKAVGLEMAKRRGL